VKPKVAASRYETYAFGPDRTKDKTPRDPIGTPGRARATLHRAHTAATVPDWFDGTLEQYREEVESAVFAEHGAVEVQAEHADIAALSADVLLFSGEPFEKVSKSRFKKDVLRAGSFIHRTTGEPIAMPPERVKNAVANTNRFLADGHKVPFPMRHTSEPDRSLGFWRSFEFTKDDEAIGVVDVERAADLDRIGTTITDVSVQIEGPVYLSDGTALDEVFTHVCATNYPVINNQRNFEPVALSLDAHGYSVYVQATDEETESVDLEALKKLLNLSADATEEDAQKAIAKLEADSVAAKKAAAAEAKKATETKATLEATVDALRSENSHLAGRLTKVEAKAIDDELNLALDTGQVSKENAPAARAALMSRQVVKLSLDGEEKPIDLADFVRDWIKNSTPVKKLKGATTLSADEDKAKKAEIMAERRMDAAAWESNNHGQKVTWFDTSATEGPGMQDYKRPEAKPVRERLGLA
jgi:hypothetical protein